MWKKSDERAECRGGFKKEKSGLNRSTDSDPYPCATLYIKSHPKMIAARSETMKNIFIFFEQGAFLVGLLH